MLSRPSTHPSIHHHHHHTYLFPALNAEVRINALTICGKIGIFKISIDRTKGDAAAPALPLEYASMSFGSLYGTLMPTERLPSTKKIVNRQKMERYALGRTARGFSACKPEEKNHKRLALLSILPRQDPFHSVCTWLISHLASSHGDILGSRNHKSGLKQTIKKSEKSTHISFAILGGESSRILPISKAKGVVFGVSTHHDDEGV